MVCVSVGLAADKGNIFQGSSVLMSIVCSCFCVNYEIMNLINYHNLVDNYVHNLWMNCVLKQH